MVVIINEFCNLLCRNLHLLTKNIIKLSYFIILLFQYKYRNISNILNYNMHNNIVTIKVKI